MLVAKMGNISIHFDNQIELMFCYLRCGNKQKCTLKADEENFGDPCPNQTKYLYVKYKCKGNLFSFTYLIQ